MAMHTCPFSPYDTRTSQIPQSARRADTYLVVGDEGTEVNLPGLQHRLPEPARLQQPQSDQGEHQERWRVDQAVEQQSNRHAPAPTSEGTHHAGFETPTLPAESSLI